MSAVLQLVNDPTIVESEEAARSKDASLYSSFTQLAEENRYLWTEVRALRDELARVERALVAQKALLNNARIREFELRSELLRDKR